MEEVHHNASRGKLLLFLSTWVVIGEHVGPQLCLLLSPSARLATLRQKVPYCAIAFKTVQNDVILKPRVLVSPLPSTGTKRAHFTALPPTFALCTQKTHPWLHHFSTSASCSRNWRQRCWWRRALAKEVFFFFFSPPQRALPDILLAFNTVTTRPLCRVLLFGSEKLHPGRPLRFCHACSTDH